MNILLWILQVLLALLFLFSGGTKIILPIEVLTAMGPPGQVQLPGLFLKFIGVCEVVGGLGLILPALLRIKPWLTPLAAAGLAIITIGATVVTLMGQIPRTLAILPAVTAILSAFVAYARWRLAPIPSK